MLQFFVFFVLAFLRLFVDSQEAVELHYRSGDAEPKCLALTIRIDVDRRLVKHGRHDLRRHKALPDQLVDLEFVFLQILLHLVWMPHRRGGTDRFVRRLRFLLLFICIRRFGQIGRAIFLAHVFAHFLNRLGRNPGRVGTHVGNQTNQTFFAQLRAFIQPLRDHHRTFHAEAQFA